MARNKVLFFSPISYFSVHSLPERILAESLENDGEEVVIINCNGILEQACLAMPKELLAEPVKRSEICRLCCRNRDAINKEFNSSAFDLDDYVNEADLDFVDAALLKLTRENLLDYSWEGIPIGRFALYEFLLTYKLNSLKFSESQWQHYLKIFRNAHIVAVAGTKFIAFHNPTRVVTYNSLYSFNRVVCHIAELNAIPHFSVHAGSHLKKRIQQLTIVKGLGFFYNRGKTMEKYRDIVLDSHDISNIESHVKELYLSNSPWVYSTKSERISSSHIRNVLRIQQSQKVVLAVMRSNDERFAATLIGVAGFDSAPIFSSQLEWLDWMRDFCLRHPEIFVIFRVHPREFPNKRENVTSLQTSFLAEYIANTNFPENLYMNFPEDSFSLYDLLKISDVVLNNSSSAGLEANLMGIPVIGLHDDLYSFDTALQTEPTSPDHYEDLILEYLSTGLNFERIVKSYRWLNYLFNEVAIDISESYNPNPRGFLKYSFIFARILRKLRLPYPDLAITGPVVNRFLSSVESKRMLYAIKNNVESHIGINDLSKPQTSNNPIIESKMICDATLRMLEAISSEDYPDLSARLLKLKRRYELDFSSRMD